VLPKEYEQRLKQKMMKYRRNDSKTYKHQKKKIPDNHTRAMPMSGGSGIKNGRLYILNQS